MGDVLDGEAARLAPAQAAASETERDSMAIEIRQTKRRIVYRAVVTGAGPGSKAMSKTFRTRAAAEAWERKMLATDEPTGHPDASDHPRT